MLKVFSIHFSEDVDLAPYHSTLSSTELERAARFKFKINQAQALIGRFYLRKMISDYLHISASKIKFTYGNFGKPYIKNSHLHFNVSHSAACIIIAISDVATIGVDIEKVNKKIDITKIADRFFTEHERKNLEEVDDHLQHEAFSRLWTRKESFIKAQGNGLNLPLHDFEVDMDADFACLKTLSMTGSDHKDWTIYHVDAPKDYMAAIAVRHHKRLPFTLEHIHIK